MGASCTRSYEVTPPGRRRALMAPPARPTNRSKDNNLRVWQPESQTQQAAPPSSSLATGALRHIHDDLVTVVLQDTLTRGERSLVSDDRDGLVLTMRKAFQSTMGHELVAGVEQILEGKVITFMSDNHIDPDFAVEVFILAPGGDAAQTTRAPHVVEQAPVERRNDVAVTRLGRVARCNR